MIINHESVSRAGFDSGARSRYRFVVDFRRRLDHATNQESLSACPLVRLSHAVRIVAARTSGSVEAKGAAGGEQSRSAAPARPIAGTLARQRGVRADRREILRTERLFRFGQPDLE